MQMGVNGAVMYPHMYGMNNFHVFTILVETLVCLHLSWGES